MPPASRTVLIALVAARRAAGRVPVLSRLAPAGLAAGIGIRVAAARIAARGHSGGDRRAGRRARGLRPAGPAGRPIPDTVPDLSLPDLAGQEKSLRAFLGHPLIINFWATWCAPCRREIPLLQQLRRAYQGQRLEIVGVAVDFRSAVADYVRSRPIDYPLLIGEDRGLAAAEQFGMQTVLPFSVFADAQGRIIAVKIGELHRDEADYILSTMRALAAGRLSLVQAHEGIAQRLKELAIERAKAGVKDS